MRRLRIAFQFLTILPVRIPDGIREDDFAGSVLFFPVVGAFQGALSVLAAMALAHVLCAGTMCTSPAASVISISIILLLIISNKGLHIDGLADTCDALGIAPTGSTASDIDKRLSVMKDSRIGAIGTIGIVGVVLMKFAVLDTLMTAQSRAAIYLLFFLMPVFSKWAMLAALYSGTPARQDGLGRMFIGRVSLARFLGSTLILSALTAAGILIDGSVTVSGPAQSRLAVYLPLVILTCGIIALLYGFSRVSTWFFNKKFGGITGDTLGAVNELAEVLFLCAAVLWIK